MALRSRRVGWLLLLAAGWLLSSSAGRADEWPVKRGPSHEPVPYHFDPAQVGRLPKAFLEDVSACVVYSGTTHLVADDGITEAITHEVTRLNGRKGIEKLGEYRSIS